MGLFKKNRLVCSVLLSISCSVLLNAQDSIVPQESIAEKTNLEFQELFFSALTEKGIKNYKKAIDKLSECNALIPKNKAVLFEMSKNYFFLKNYPEAIEYSKLALEQEPKNVWILRHLIAIYEKQRDYSNAIKQQKILAEISIKNKAKLAFLYFKNKDYTSAKKILEDLESKKMLNARLRSILKSLVKVTERKKVQKEKKVIAANFEKVFNETKSYKSLKKLLIHLDSKNDSKFLEYSKNGVDLFPAQPFIYLMNGKALNKNKNFKKAIESLANGIDFVIEDPQLLSKFYKELLKSYQGLGDKKNIEKYRKKLNS